MSGQPATTIAARGVRRWRSTARLALLAALPGLLIAAAAGVGTAAPLHRAASAKTRTIRVYFLKGEQFEAVSRTVAAGTSSARAAIAELLAGPTAAELARGIDTTLPRGATLGSLTVKAGLATVVLDDAQTAPTPFDISLRPARAAQIVYTLTAVPGIRRVLIQPSELNRKRFEGPALGPQGALDRTDLARPATTPSISGGPTTTSAPAKPRAVQLILVRLHYLPAGAVTGRWDYATTQAVIAFQAWQGLARDGVVGPLTLAALQTASPPQPTTTRTGRSIEVYRSKGVTLLLSGKKLVLAVHSSSGGPGYETPTGTYTIFRKERNSWSVPYQVWLPYASYFNAGIAFHEYGDIPAVPASHGCVRLPVSDAPFVYDFASDGTPVTVY